MYVIDRFSRSDLEVILTFFRAGMREQEKALKVLFGSVLWGASVMMFLP
jgi:hypothetical protein